VYRQVNPVSVAAATLLFDVVDSCVPLHQGNEAIDAHSFEKSTVFCHIPE
jgi:hypothetical protein